MLKVFKKISYNLMIYKQVFIPYELNIKSLRAWVFLLSKDY
jgi:hypothetical protein